VKDDIKIYQVCNVESRLKINKEFLKNELQEKNQRHKHIVKAGLGKEPEKKN
jgi:hypothetical protein